MIDIEKVKGIIEERTKIGTMSRDYGHTVDDVLHIESPYELTLIESALTELDCLQKKEVDLKKYFELNDKPRWTDEDKIEFEVLDKKLRGE